MSKTIIRTYTQLSRLETFEERFQYLQIKGNVGKETFGFDRIFNQRFYTSAEWRKVRNYVIVRDLGCNLGIEGREITGERIIIHHMNPIDLSDIVDVSEFLMNPEYLICTTHNTHNAIHYGLDSGHLVGAPIERRQNDTCPWKN